VPPVPIRWLLVRDPTGELEPQAFLATDLNALPGDILAWFVSRWQVEVTFAEVRTHLGVETQRQWSDKAILRTTPVLLGLFSIERPTSKFGQCTRWKTLRARKRLSVIDQFDAHDADNWTMTTGPSP
jgi:hypothetical protein